MCFANATATYLRSKCRACSSKVKKECNINKQNFAYLCHQFCECNTFFSSSQQPVICRSRGFWHGFLLASWKYIS